ncbi:MAG: DUF3450 family protein [Opitutaceae bacterium]|jgi:hypothetical protein|nr:DUF3450 family protein [Opitutaceae bacterium]
MPPLLLRTASGRLITFGLGSLSFCFAAFANPLTDLQKSAAKWSQIRSETSRLESDWVAERSVLKASISGLNIEADQLELEQRALASEAQKHTEEINALTARNQANDAAIAQTVDRLATLSGELIALRPALPPRLSHALDLPFRTIAQDDLKPADRMRHTMAILNRCQQFDQTFVMTEEVLPVEKGGEDRLLEIVYWGLSQACALDRSANETFIGRPVDGVWRWVPAPGLAEAAAKLIAVRQDEVPPDFVTLPFQVTGGEK